MKKLADRSYKLSLSQTLAISAKANKMKSKGVDVVNLTVGEPDFPTPHNIKAAAITAINENFTKYTNSSGIEPLRQAVVDKYSEEFGVTFDWQNVTISNGAKQALNNVIMAVCEEGDEVIIPTPSWLSYPEMVLLSGATPVLVYADENSGFKITAEQLRSKITKSTKLLILCSPSNPTGAVYSREELEELVEVIKESNIYVIFDEIYEKLIYDDKRHVSLCEFDEIREQVILINGVSKSYSMTGWRIGYSIANEEISKVIRKLQSHMTANPNSIAQKAAIEAIRGDQAEVERMRQIFNKRRLAGYEKLKSIEGVDLIMPSGAFYFYVDFSEYLNRRVRGRLIESTDDLTNYFLEDLLVAAVSGTSFGSTKHVRFSFACSEFEFLRGLDRIEAGLKKLM
ncbi:MAG: pyridoxal phosphate-dependent aminotransferase [Candidatus Delongbacteria bacterium]|nr:pyridoxal phosphate-dependent aminotransferase [Candidatus Delongbacteria bacterium]MBN2833893.1 pyridoxal phosphate-dependent aminotransferase [Candidatus Delongbacteria bacterium]